MRNLVRIGGNAFTQLFLGAYTKHEKEQNGYLIGEVSNVRRRKKFDVEIVQLSQGHTTKKMAYIDRKEEERLRYITDVFGPGLVGGFHSHVFEHAIMDLSSDDFKILREDYSNGIEILITLTPTFRPTRLNVSPLTISGCFRDNDAAYRMKFGAYYVNLKKNGEIGRRRRRAQIHVPHRKLKEYF